MCCTSFDRQCRQRHRRKSVQSRAADTDAVMVGAASNSGGGGDGGDELSCCRPCGGGGGGGGFGVGDGDECSCCRTCPLLRRWRQLQHRAHTHTKLHVL